MGEEIENYVGFTPEDVDNAELVHQSVLEALPVSDGDEGASFVQRHGL